MKFNIIATVLSVVGLPMLAMAVSTPPPDAIPGYTIFIPQWEVELTPGGDKVILNGTVQEVHAEMVKRNPKWDVDFDFTPPATSAVGTRAQPDGFKMVKRNDFKGHDAHCFQIFEDCNRASARHGVEYLRGVSGKPNSGPGPGECGRVSCSYNAAIYWCNDDTKEKTLDSYDLIADGAEHIVNSCHRGLPQWPQYWDTQGQTFHDDNWNVIVRGGDSC